MDRPRLYFDNVEDAKRLGEAWLIIDTDCGGAVFLTCPISMVNCNTATLLDLAEDLAKIGGDIMEDCGIYVDSQVRVGETVAGTTAYGVGRISYDLWVERAFVEAGMYDRIKLVIKGKAPDLGLRDGEISALHESYWKSKDQLFTEITGKVRPAFTAVDLKASVLRLIEQYKSRYKNGLAEYLRSILLSVRKHRHYRPTYLLFARILEEGFNTPPIAFEQEWLSRTRPPGNPWWTLRRDHVEPIVQHNDPTQSYSDFQCLEETLLFQIAELCRFSEKKPGDYGQYSEYARDYKYYGLESPTGHTWYNWDPFTYLECAMAGFISPLEEDRFDDTTLGKCKWATLAAILELGRTYE